MKTRLTILTFWDDVRNSFWFLPAVLGLGAVLLFALTAYLDIRYADQMFEPGRFLFRGGTVGANALLSTLATSMITVAGVLFSITVVVLTLASSQLGPRLIRSFMSDQASQLVLGSFVAIFLFCVLVLARVPAEESGNDLPFISIMVALLLAVINAGIVIFYIHHISISIQADQIIDRVSGAIKKEIRRMARPGAREPGEEDRAKARELFQPPSAGRLLTVETPDSGYLQAIDIDALKRLATEHDAVLKLDCRPGDYKLAHTRLLTARLSRQEEDLKERIQEMFTVGKIKTPVQDIEFSIEQIVQVALRALSPSLNDPFTAITCIDKLSAILIEFMEHEGDSFIYDDKGRLRLIIDRIHFKGMLEACYDTIRQAGCGKPAITIRLLERIGDMFACASTEECRRVLAAYARTVKESSDAHGHTGHDRDDIERRYRRVAGAVSSSAII